MESQYLLPSNEYTVHRSEFFQYLERQEQSVSHERLRQRLQDLQNSNVNTELYVFGKLKREILEHVENYALKELYIEREKWKKLQTFVSDPQVFNFKVYPIYSLDKNDIAEIFINQYNGLMGIKYF